MHWPKAAEPFKLSEGDGHLRFVVVVWVMFRELRMESGSQLLSGTTLNMIITLCVVKHRYCTTGNRLWSHPVGMRLDGQSRVDGQHFKKERELPVECVLDLWPQAPWEICNPLSQCPLGYPVVLDESVTFGVSTHPKLERQQKTQMIRLVSYHELFSNTRGSFKKVIYTTIKHPNTCCGFINRLPQSECQADLWAAVFRHTWAC